MNIIELAKQAGLKRHQEQAPGIDGVVANWADLKQFAALVAAQEREACANMCMAVPRTGAYFSRLIRARGTT